MKAAILVFASALAFVLPAWSADKHGGHEVEVGKFHVELVVKDKALTLYVRDSGDKPIDAKTVSASANVLSGKDKATIPLAVVGDGLKGDAPFAISADAKVVVTFSVAGGKKEQARFSFGQKQDHKGHKH